MKYYILLIYLLAFSLATEGNTAVKDSLSEALPSASSPLQKLEIMTNLMDLSPTGRTGGICQTALLART